MVDFKSVDEICPLPLSIALTASENASLNDFQKRFTSRRFNFNWHLEQDVNLEVWSDNLLMVGPLVASNRSVITKIY